jgi:hypothetical protein
VGEPLAQVVGDVQLAASLHGNEWLSIGRSGCRHRRHI